MIGMWILISIGILSAKEIIRNPLPDPSLFSGFDSLNVRFVGNWPFGVSMAVAFDDARNVVFLGSGGGFYIFDVSNPSNPVKMSEKIHTRGIVYGLFYVPSNQILFIADGQGGLEIWDVSNLLNPYKLGYYLTPDKAMRVYVSGPYAYVADGDAGLRIINVSNPTNPYEVGYYDTPYFTQDIYVSGPYAYLTEFDDMNAPGWLRIIDISDPSNPYQVGQIGFLDYAIGVYVSHPYAYVAAFDTGFFIIDISDPSNPVPVGHVGPPQTP